MLKGYLGRLLSPRPTRRDDPDRLDRLLIFLGNPGNEYSRTRHNLGFMVGERFLAQSDPGASLHPRFKGRFWSGDIERGQIGILLPSTFMNDSGVAAAKALNHFQVNVENVVVTCDDMDLDFGLMRLRRGGSSGGHLGVESIINKLESPEFLRLKLGVGRPPAGVDPVAFLLSDFEPDEWPFVDDMVGSAAAALNRLLREPAETVMNEYNRRTVSD